MAFDYNAYFRCYYLNKGFCRLKAVSKHNPHSKASPNQEIIIIYLNIKYLYKYYKAVAAIIKCKLCV